VTDYSLMDLLDDFILGPLNWVDRLEWLVRGALYGDFGAKFAIPRADKSENDAPTLNEVERLLKRYGIAVYGRTHDSRNMYFHVKNRQARWAEYILLHAGVKLRNPTVDSRNAGYLARHAPGWMSEAWADRKRRR